MGGPQGPPFSLMEIPLIRRTFPILVSLLLAFPLLAAAPARPYHVSLEANLAAPFPFLSKCGAVDIDVYPQGVVADSIWLDGFAKTGTGTVTVMNPIARMYADVPVAQVAPTLAKLASALPERSAAGVLGSATAGTIKGFAATRYRVVYGPQAWIDVWTTNVVPPNPQFRALAVEFVRGIAPETAKLMNSFPGTPVYVELNFRRFKKVPILTLKSITFGEAPAADAFQVGTIYFKAPFIDSLLK